MGQSPAQSSTAAVISMRQLGGTLNKHQMRSRKTLELVKKQLPEADRKQTNNQKKNPAKPNPEGFHLTKKGGVRMTNLAILAGQTSRKRTCRRVFKY